MSSQGHSFLKKKEKCILAWTSVSLSCLLHTWFYRPVGLYLLPNLGGLQLLIFLTFFQTCPSSLLLQNYKHKCQIFCYTPTVFETLFIFFQYIFPYCSYWIIYVVLSSSPMIPTTSNLLVSSPTELFFCIHQL